MIKLKFNIVRSALFLLILTIFLTGNVWAKRPVPQEPPTIDTAVVDFSSFPYQAQITGDNLMGLDAGSPAISVGGLLVDTYSLLSTQQLNFEIPAGIATQGTYLMTLSNDKGHVNYELTIGTVGPTGPQGE